MRATYICTLIMILLGLSIGCIEEKIAPEMIAEKMINNQGKIQDISYTEVLNFFDNGLAKTSELDFTYQKPNMFKKGLNNSTGLTNQLIFSNGTTTWVYDRDKNFVFISASLPNVIPELTYFDLVNSMIENYTIKLEAVEHNNISNKSPIYIINLIPNESRYSVPGNWSYQLWVESKNWFPLKIITYDNRKPISVIEYRNVIINSDLKDEDFIFKVPNSAEVIIKKD
ncbi:MAG: outer membrane lipoprotein carrier protein LolA [Candidatus Methanoperedens sp.]|nr:outer membrane lipoprotein carrier protein LolA [Candidatus Methanoperedens sp.]